MSLKEKLEKITEDWVTATNENFTDHPTANLFRHEFKEEIEKLVKDFDSSYEVKASVGAGQWANIPWLSILNPNITTTTQDGIYPVYLFKADGAGLYLSLNQGTTKPKKNLGKNAAEDRAENIKNTILNKIPELAIWGSQEIRLNANTNLGKSYEKPNISAKYYDAKDIPDSQTLKEDLLKLLGFYQQIFNQKLSNTEHETQVNNKDLELMPPNITLISKPFLLLAGISGTGKSRFIREQAKTRGFISDTYCLVSVRPDWHEPSDLLGYISRLNKDGDAKYVTTDTLLFIAKAWREMVDAGLSVTAKDIDNQGKRMVVEGNQGQLDDIFTYWLCLDEMNLAPVEQYFADYLSVLETREWRWQNNNFEYLSDPLLKAATIHQLDKPDKLRKEFGLVDTQYDGLWKLFCKYGVGIPFNLIVAGTVNMDETTHSFSRKVIDRALSFDFGEFFPNNFADYFTPRTRNKTLSYPIWSQAEVEQLPIIDNDGQKSIAFLQAVNQELDNTPFKLAFRALNELLLAIVSAQPQNDTELKAVWDDFLMCKVLPRIEGDADTLIQESIEQSLLIKLSRLLEKEFTEFWHEPNNSATARPDLYREKIEGDDKVIRITCRSRGKIEWMQARLMQSGFTSFWP